MNIAEMLAALTKDDRRWAIDDVGEWRQGRTLYGGITAMLMHEVARRESDDLPPLRAGQVAFIGPATTDLAIEAEVLRSGRNVTQIATRLHSEGRLAASATWIFGAAMEPNALNRPSPEPIETPPEDSPPLAEGGHAPEFIERLDQRRVSLGKDMIAVRRWARLAEREDVDPINGALALGDALPPGSLKAMRRMGPLSSINWSFTIIDPSMTTRDGWFLLETESRHADEGYSTEQLSMWNSDGEPVMLGMQSVAIFG